MQSRGLGDVYKRQGLENEENPQIDENNQGEYFIVMPKAKKIYRIYKK